SQPRWSPDGALHWISDRTGWWNLYRDGEPLAPMDAEFAGPDWVLGQSTYALLPDGRLVAAWSRGGTTRLAVLGDEPPDLPYTPFSSIRVFGDRIAAIAASPTIAPQVVVLDDPPTVVRRSRPTPVDPGYLSTPRPIEFPTTGGGTAHALFYPPTNQD